MNLDDGLSLLELPGETGILVTQAVQLTVPRVVEGLTAPLIVPEGLEDPFVVLPSPERQLGGHQALSSQQGPDLSGLGTTTGLFDDLGLIRP